jgi:hypothetical protein
MLIRIREVNFVWIHADLGLDPKHCPLRVLLSALASRLVFAPFFILFSLEFIAFTGKRKRSELQTRRQDRWIHIQEGILTSSQGIDKTGSLEDRSSARHSRVQAGRPFTSS